MKISQGPEFNFYQRVKLVQVSDSQNEKSWEIRPAGIDLEEKLGDEFQVALEKTRRTCAVCNKLSQECICTNKNK